VALGFYDIPLTVVSETSFDECSSDLVRYLKSAMDLSLQVLVQNSIGENGFMRFDVTDFRVIARLNRVISDRGGRPRAARRSPNVCIRARRPCRRIERRAMENP